MPAGDGSGLHWHDWAPAGGRPASMAEGRPAVPAHCQRSPLSRFSEPAGMLRVLIVALLLLIVVLQLKLWGGEGMTKVDELEAAIASQRAENARLQARNAALEAEVVNLKEAREAIEERARSELGLIGEDEIFYQVIESERRPGSQQESER